MKIDAIQKFFSQNKKFFLWSFLSISFFFCFTEATFAAGESPWDLGGIVIDAINGWLKIVSALLWVLTAFVSLFLYPGWVNGTIFGLDEYMKEMWILISNVVYFIFAFILIAIAFMNIIGKWDKWELKAALPRFMVWVLIVPFSWFFVQFVLSVSAVLTVWVLTLPYDTFKDKDLFSDVESDIPICTHLELYLSSTPEDTGWTDTAFGEFMKCKEDGTKTISQILSGEGWEGWEGVQNSIFGITSIYTYGVLGIDGLDTITKEQLTGPDAIKAILDLGLKGIFDLIFVIMYFILMAALFLALFVRGIRLWMYAMFSPAFGLLYFFEKGKEGVGDGEAKFSVSEFISLAMVPVYVSAALSFGLVFLFVASQWIQETWNGSADVNTLDLWGFKISIFWEQGNGKTEKSTLARLIIQLFGLAMLWIAVMAALKQSETTKKITAPIAQFWGQVGSLVASAPMYAPIIPGWAAGWISATWLQQIGASMKSHVEDSSRQTGTDFLKERWIAGQSLPLTNNAIAAQTAFDASWGDPERNREVWSKFREALVSGQDAAQLSRNQDFVKLLQDMLRSVGKEDEANAVQLNNATSVAKGIGILDYEGERNFSSQWGNFMANRHWSEPLTARELTRFLESWGAAGWWDDDTPPTVPDINFSFDASTHTASGQLSDDAVNDIAESIRTNFNSWEFREAQIRLKLVDLIDGVNDEWAQATRVIQKLWELGFEFTTR